SSTASASVSMRNHVLPPGASQTYLIIPPSLASGVAGIARVGMRCPEKQNPEFQASQQQHQQVGRDRQMQLMTSRNGSGFYAAEPLKVCARGQRRHGLPQPHGFGSWPALRSTRATTRQALP